jgi:hypothetical protein
MRIRCIRAGGARRRAAPSISLIRGPDSQRIRAFFLPLGRPEAKTAPLGGSEAWGSFVRLVSDNAVIALHHRQRCRSLTTCRKTCRRYWPEAVLHFRGCGAAGSARPCQGRGHGFDSRHPLHFGCACTTPPACCLGKGMAGCARGSAPCAASDPRRPRACGSRADTAEMEFAPVMELEYMPALEAGFWEFKSPLGHQLLSPA